MTSYLQHALENKLARALGLPPPVTYQDSFALIIPSYKARQAGTLNRFTLLHKLPPSDNQTNCFSFYAISDLVPQGIIFKQWRRGVSCLGSPGLVGLAESAWGNRMRARKQERKVKVKQESKALKRDFLYFFFYFTERLCMS